MPMDVIYFVSFVQNQKIPGFTLIIDCYSSRRMRRHIRDLNVESARDFKLNQAARCSNNKENDQKMAANAYLFSVYVLHTCVS